MKRWLITTVLCLAVTNLQAAGANPVNLLTGRVMSADGASAAGALVRVSALDPAPPDGPYRDPEVGLARTGADGRFVIPLSLNSKLAPLADFHGGALNLWVEVERFGQQPVFDMAVARPAGGVLVAPPPLVLTTRFPSVAGPSASRPQSCGSLAPEITTVGREFPFEPVGEMHTFWDMSANFEYGEEANTDLGGAYRQGAGGWTVTAGAAHMGNKVSAVTGKAGDHFGKVQLTKFRYRQDKLAWYENGFSGDHPCRVDYRIVPEAWHGADIIDGRDVSNGDGPNEVYKEARRHGGWYGEFGPNKGWYKHTGRGTKYTFDVSAFGVGMHAQSTWSQWVDITYSFGPNTAAPHWLYANAQYLKDADVVYAY